MEIEVVVIFCGTRIALAFRSFSAGLNGLKSKISVTIHTVNVKTRMLRCGKQEFNIFKCNFTLNNKLDFKIYVFAI